MQINCNDRGNDTGFFCKIPFPDKCHQLRVLMTNNHVINKDDLKKDNKINFTINNDKLSFEIIIDEFRKIYTNKDYDITIIEIKENDNLDMNSFLEIDDQIFNDNHNDIYRGKTIYLIGYPKGGKPKYANGLIKDINENTYDIRHFCRSEQGWSGCRILNLNNNRVIGIHKGAAKKGQNWNLGTLLKEPIKDFKEKNIHNKNYKNNEYNYIKKVEKDCCNNIKDEIIIESLEFIKEQQKKDKIGILVHY